VNHILIITTSRLTACLAGICGAAFGLRVESAPTSVDREIPDGMILDLNALSEEAGRAETRHLASSGLPAAVLGEALDASRPLALNRRGVSTYRRLDEGVLHDLAWQLAKRRARRAA
jgi:hypothetical protein